MLSNLDWSYIVMSCHVMCIQVKKFYISLLERHYQLNGILSLFLENSTTISFASSYFCNNKKQCGSFSNYSIDLDSDHKQYIQSQGFNHWDFWQHLEKSRYLILCANRKHYPAVVRPPVNRFMEMLQRRYVLTYLYCKQF